MRPRTVLLLDSDPDSANIYSVMLEHDGFRVVLARSMEQAYEEACTAAPDVVVLEVAPGPDPDAPLIELLRNDSRTSHVPIIATSTVLLPEGHRARAACDCFILKPCVPTRMLTEVRRFVAPLPVHG